MNFILFSYFILFSLFSVTNAFVCPGYDKDKKRVLWDAGIGCYCNTDFITNDPIGGCQSQGCRIDTTKGYELDNLDKYTYSDSSINGKFCDQTNTCPQGYSVDSGCGLCTDRKLDADTVCTTCLNNPLYDTATCTVCANTLHELSTGCATCLNPALDYSTGCLYKKCEMGEVVAQIPPTEYFLSEYNTAPHTGVTLAECAELGNVMANKVEGKIMAPSKYNDGVWFAANPFLEVTSSYYAYGCIVQYSSLFTQVKFNTMQTDIQCGLSYHYCVKRIPSKTVCYNDNTIELKDRYKGKYGDLCL
jgi:hypothetical protein